MVSGIVIRRAAECDIPGIEALLTEIKELHRAARPDIFREGPKYDSKGLAALLSDESRPVFVAVTADGQTAGHAFCIITDYRGHSDHADGVSLYLDDLCVGKAFRGQGIGSALFDRVVAAARECGADTLDLNVWEFNKNAVEFYEKRGMTTRNRHLELRIK